VQIEGDWSSAAFLLVAAALAGERIKVEGVDQVSLQADRQLLNILEMMEARMRTDLSSVTMERSQLRHVEVDVSDCPDLFPAVCALCTVADGVSTITGTRRLRLKESNRVLAMKDGLKQMEIETRETENSFTIHGGKPRGGTVDPHHDHRIAMAFATLGLCTDGVTIRNAECVSKSYPSFWDDLRSLGAEATMR
jgi:3-phosphoshikimate 1-carboxyvinyltransferase